MPGSQYKPLFSTHTLTRRSSTADEEGLNRGLVSYSATPKATASDHASHTETIPASVMHLDKDDVIYVCKRQVTDKQDSLAISSMQPNNGRCSDWREDHFREKNQTWFRLPHSSRTKFGVRYSATRSGIESNTKKKSNESHIGPVPFTKSFVELIPREEFDDHGQLDPALVLETIARFHDGDSTATLDDLPASAAGPSPQSASLPYSQPHVRVPRLRVFSRAPYDIFTDTFFGYKIDHGLLDSAATLVGAKPLAGTWKMVKFVPVDHPAEPWEASVPSKDVMDSERESESKMHGMP